VLRWFDDVPVVLDLLERAVLRSRLLQQIVLRAHESAIARSLAGVPEFRRVVIIGGGLFPRTAIIMRRLWPHASITIVDRNAEHLKTAQALLGNSVVVIEHSCDASSQFDADLIVVPLAFVGDRDAFYESPPAPVVLVHDWIWRRRGEGTRVSWWLLKRVNVVRREGGVISNAAATNGRRAA
jgi:threonine dehydrogenase-like Zn-dependent dehydrogenase